MEIEYVKVNFLKTINVHVPLGHSLGVSTLHVLQFGNCCTSFLVYVYRLLRCYIAHSTFHDALNLTVNQYIYIKFIISKVSLIVHTQNLYLNEHGIVIMLFNIYSQTR